MAIGPEARRAVSGRIVVVAGFYGVLGTASIVVGLGPLIMLADVMSRVLALGAITGGTTLVVGSAGLFSKRRWSRRFAILGGSAAISLGLVTIALASDALVSCGSMPAPQDCIAVTLGLALIGLTITVCGIGSVAIIRRARPGAFRRRRPY